MEEFKCRGYAGDVPVYCAHDKIVPVGEVKPNPKNPNHHPEEQIELLAKIIKTQGWRAPITVSTRSGLVVRGHGRLLAAKFLGLECAPVDFQHYKSNDAELADLLADNKIAELAEIDAKMLAEVFKDIDPDEIDIDITGYSEDEYNDIVNALMDATAPEPGELDEDEVVEPPKQPVSRYVNNPVKLIDYASATRYMGYSSNWALFDLCEAFKLHFNNPMGNVGPIVAINVLDPATHKKDAETTKSLSFVNGRATFESDTIILDTLVLADKVEGTDFAIDYDFTKGQVIINSIGNAITGTVQATYSEVDTSKVTKEDIIGGATAAGEYSGLGCIVLVYPELSLIPNIICCPGWSHETEVYNAMITAGTKINGHWDAIVCADIPVLDGATKVDTIEAAKKWKADNAYISERAKVFWPMAKDNEGNLYHGSTLGVWQMLTVDAQNNGIPMESPSNKAVPVVKQYFGEGSTNRGFDQQRANELNAEGITTVVFWGGLWVLWGPHTAAYKFGAITDNRVVFDNSIRLMMYVSNSFQQEHALTIDKPMTRAMADTIKNREQEKMDALAAIGAFIGTPVVEFTETENSVGDLVEGNFTWGFKGTPTPPFKSGTMKVAYTTDGFDSYFGEV